MHIQDHVPALIRPATPVVCGTASDGSYSRCGYNRRGTIRERTMTNDPTPESLLPLPPATLHILLAVAETDRHGYAIMQDVEARTDGELRLSAGTLYRAVARMVEQGLLTEVEKRRTRADDERRRYYRITSFGLSVARAEVRRLMQLVRHAQARGLTPRAV